MARAGPPAALLIATAAIAAVVLWPRRASAAVSPSPGFTPTLPPAPSPIIGADYGDWWGPLFPAIDTPPMSPWLPIPDVVIDDPWSDPVRRLAAFLFMIRSAEHSPSFSDAQRYGLGYGSKPFYDFSNHPVITGELSPVRLPDRFCAPAGLRPPCFSTAAGAYQIIRPTWERVRRAGAWGPALPDFGPASQDEAARRLLIEVGALPLIERGDIGAAVAKAAPVWASLPGSTAQQNPKSLQTVLAFFEDGLRFG